MDTSIRQPVFKTRQSNLPVKSKTKSEFINVLIKATTNNRFLQLNFPETLVRNTVELQTYMIFTNDEGCLVCKESVKSLYEHRFMKRCYYFQRPYNPITVFKSFNGLNQTVQLIMNIKDSYKAWKSKSAEISLLQRYVYPNNSNPCKFRVEYLVTEAIYTKTLVKSGNISRQKSFKDAEDYLDTNSLKLSEEDELDVAKVTEDSIKVQMQTLKKIIEAEEVKGQPIISIVADFIQDLDLNWYFISMISYKYESFLPKLKLQKPKKRSRLKATSTTALPMLPQPLLHPSNSIQYKELLKQEVLNDLLDFCY